MPDAFHTQIRHALQDPNLQAALDGNAERRRQVRLHSYASLDEDLDVLRRRAHDLRQSVIDHLDEHLEAFAARARDNGMIVHHAADAAQACAIVLEITRAHGARRVAKSKTMVGEEIEINHALEQAGLEVVETDLGEYIVQLRHERPAHIITPAVHLRRADVARLFADKLGIPYTENIPELTAAARRTLRQVFLEAEVGISGVNFGVVENGTLCLVTNEGNGRMVTSLPPVHIALMGIERLAPTLDDLALLLSLLPRSATGQKLSVYTGLIAGPRRPGEADGPLERHLVLVDNGRRAMRRSPLAEALLCIRCGACLNACPVFREIGGHGYVSPGGAGTPYPGPIGSVISPALFGSAEFGNLARASSLCGACKDACPVEIDLPKLLLRLRAGLGPGSWETSSNTHPTPAPAAAAPGQGAPPALKFGLRVFGWLAAAPGRFALAQRLAGLGGRLLGRTGWLRMPAFTGWGLSRDFPAPAAQTFQQRWQKRQPAAHRVLPGPAIAPAPAAPDSAAPIPAAPAQVHITAPELAQRFTQELRALGGQVIACSEAELPAQILGWLHERQLSQVLAWEEAWLPAGLPEALRQAGVSLAHQADPTLPVGLTGARAGIAETGSLLLEHGPGRPQAAALLPGIHLAILRLADLHATLGQALHSLSGQPAANRVIISGPSRTADIEMTLTIGVHGPGELWVFLVG